MKTKLLIILGVVLCLVRIAIGQKPAPPIDPLSLIVGKDDPLIGHPVYFNITNSAKWMFGYTTNATNTVYMNVETVIVTNPPTLVYSYASTACPICGQVHHQQNVSVSTVTEDVLLKGEYDGKPFKFLVRSKGLRQVNTTNETAAAPAYEPRWLNVPNIKGEWTPLTLTNSVYLLNGTSFLGRDFNNIYP